MTDPAVQHAERTEIALLEGIRTRCPDNDLVLKALGDLYTHIGAYRKGLDVDVELVERCPTEPLVWYNLACSRALLRQTQDAFVALRNAIALGYTDHDCMAADRDLDSLRDDPRFEALLNQLREG